MKGKGFQATGETREAGFFSLDNACNPETSGVKLSVLWVKVELNHSPMQLNLISQKDF